MHAQVSFIVKSYFCVKIPFLTNQRTCCSTLENEFHISSQPCCNILYIQVRNRPEFAVLPPCIMYTQNISRSAMFHIERVCELDMVEIKL